MPEKTRCQPHSAVTTGFANLNNPDAVSRSTPDPAALRPSWTMSQNDPHVTNIRVSRPGHNQAPSIREKRIGIIPFQILHRVQPAQTSILYHLRIRHRTRGIRRTVFAIGPAGTGKTYLAVALAVAEAALAICGPVLNELGSNDGGAYAGSPAVEAPAGATT